MNFKPPAATGTYSIAGWGNNLRTTTRTSAASNKAVETYRIEGAAISDLHDAGCRFEVVVGFSNPLPEDLDDLRRDIHRELCPRAMRANTPY